MLRKVHVSSKSCSLYNFKTIEDNFMKLHTCTTYKGHKDDVQNARTITLA